MMIRDLKCDPDSFAGPVDQRVVQQLLALYPLELAFVEQIAACHGAVPVIATFDVKSTTASIERFLTLLDEDSALEGPKRPHFDQSEMDERVMIGIPYLMDYEHQTSRTLFTDLVPFAALLDDMCLDRGEVDLLCLDFRDKAKPPSVVIWVGGRALNAYMDWESLPLEEQFDEQDNYLNVPWSDFLVPVSDNFEQFVLGLRDSKG